MAQTPATMYSSDEAIDYTPPTTAVVGGDVVEVGTIPFVATNDIAVGVKGSLATEGVFKVPKATGAFTAGDAVYWDNNGSPVTGTALSGAATSTASGNNLMGLAVLDAASGDSYVNVLLTSAKRTTTIAGSVTADDITGTDSSLGIGGLASTQGGTVVVTGGASSTSGNAGGAVSLVGGTPGATGVGGAITVSGGVGGTTSGAGGATTIAGGAGTLNANGGAMLVLGGAKNGSGTNGTLGLGTSNTSAITIGATSIATAIPGPITPGIGASTAAAGSVTGDAGALPAGTASVYPTTGANDTTGVVISTSDKVTGRMLMIGNGVSNKILKVYPPSGGTINGAAGDAAFSSASGKGVIVVCLSSGSNTWLAW